MRTLELQQIKQKYNIVGNCDALNRALDVALQVAPTDLSVLIEGESGVGKEIIPRVIHESSPRAKQPYFAINCGSIPEGTIDSELFGHEKGSFTGALGESPGYFGVANEGTIFLDEVGELPLATQARLLRVLETGEYIRVGGTKVLKTNVRIVAATNVNVRKAISEGRFREDLYYRLNTIPIHMPPLRDRGNDVLLLFRLFALQMKEKYKLPHIELDDNAKEMLLKYKWPGNVRQLKNVTEQISVLSEDRLITADVLSRFIPVDEESTMLAPVNPSGSYSYESEREMLYKILFDLRGNVSELRKELNNLREKLNTSQSAQMQQYANNANLTGGYMPVNEGIESVPSHRVAPHHVGLEYAQAEEIKETEALNFTDMKRNLLRRTLEKNRGNRKKTAQELGVSERTLYRQIKQYNILDDED